MTFQFLFCHTDTVICAVFRPMGIINFEHKETVFKKPWTTHDKYDNALRWGVKKLVDRLREDELKPFFVGLFPKVCRTACRTALFGKG